MPASLRKLPAMPDCSALESSLGSWMGRVTAPSAMPETMMHFLVEARSSVIATLAGRMQKSTIWLREQFSKSRCCELTNWRIDSGWIRGKYPRTSYLPNADIWMVAEVCCEWQPKYSMLHSLPAERPPAFTPKSQIPLRSQIVDPYHVSKGDTLWPDSSSLTAWRLLETWYSAASLYILNWQLSHHDKTSCPQASSRGTADIWE